MDFSFTGLSFGDFSGLTPEENQRVKTILLRPKEAQPPNGPEFPWSEEEFRLSFGVDRITEIADSFASVHIQSIISHGGSSISQRDSPVVIDMECDIASAGANSLDFKTPQLSDDVRSDITMTSSSQYSSERRSSNERKPYERRNKKKRPPGYYESVYNNPSSNVNNKDVHTDVSETPIDSSQRLQQSPNHIEMTDNLKTCDNMPEVLMENNISDMFETKNAALDGSTVNDPLINDLTSVQLNHDLRAYSDFDTAKSDCIVLNENYDDDKINCDIQNMNSSVPVTNICETDDNVIEFLQDSNLPNTNLTVDSSSDHVINSLDNTGELIIPLNDADAAAVSTAVNDCVNIHAKDAASEDNDDVKYVNIEKPKANSIPSFSWASLFKKKEADMNHSQLISQNVNYDVVNASGDFQKPHGDMLCNDKKEDANNENEYNATTQLGNLLLNLQLNHRPISLQPRGLANRGNWCYVNATLQALLACPPFYHLIKSLPSYPALMKGPSCFPVIDSIVEFVNEFTAMKFPAYHTGSKGKKDNIRQDISCGQCFEPVYVYDMLQSKSDVFKHGKQEDAEEFLSYLLNGIHEEMLAAEKSFSGPKENQTEVANGYGSSTESGDDEEEDESWEQVGPKKKSMITRVAEFSPSAISSIFCGQMRSVLHQPGSRESATLQPFFTLQLDIQSDRVRSVKDALEGLLTRENVQGYTCSKTKTEVEASRRLMLEVLPPVLILHLKYFIFNKDGGCQKLLKRIDYSVDLEINKDLLAPSTKSKLSQTQRTYKLFAVEYHHGRNAAGGHYTVDVYHPGIQGWVHMDDSIVYSIPVSQVLKHITGHVPYLLYYRRCDLLTS